MHRIYTSTAHFRAPFDTPNISFAGLGSNGLNRQWPAGRTYYDTSQFRAPYDDGYYQSGGLRGFDSGRGLTLSTVAALGALAWVLSRNDSRKMRMRHVALAVGAASIGIAVGRSSVGGA